MFSENPTAAGALPEIREKDIRDKLAALVRNFDRDSADHRLQIRLMARDRQSFYQGALHILAGHDDSRGSQFLISTLAENGLLLQALSDPLLTRDQALAVAGTAALAGQMVDIAIAHHLSENMETIGRDACPPGIQRLMDILAEVSDGARILPSLMALARQPNPYIQSKAVLMIGRINRNVKWVETRLRDPDPRVRGNAIEALWGVDSIEVRRLLRSAAADNNNRVAGNALIALYQLGDCWSIPELLEMASHESRRFRATAAWAMGATGDPRFTRILARMVAEPNIAVRTRAFASLGQIKAAAVVSRQAAEWTVIAAFRRMRTDGRREVRADVCSSVLRRIDVPATRFVLSEDGNTIMNYTVDERPVPPTLAVAFLCPAARADAFLGNALLTLAWKRPSDLWAALPYVLDQDDGLRATLLNQKIEIEVKAPENAEVDRPLEFSSESARITETLRKAAATPEPRGLWAALRRSVQTAPVLPRVQHHVIAYCEQAVRRPVFFAELLSAALASHTTIHAISLVPNAALENLCKTTKGSFRVSDAGGDAAKWVEREYLRLVARYNIVYNSTNPASQLNIRVQSPAGAGETQIEIPR